MIGTFHTLKNPLKRAYDKLEECGTLNQKTWEELLSDTKQAHDDFLSSRNQLLKESAENLTG